MGMASTLVEDDTNIGLDIRDVVIFFVDFLFGV